VSDLAVALRTIMGGVEDSEIVTLEIIGDANAPGLIADAVYSGHLAARNFQKDPLVVEREFFLREMPGLEMDMRQDMIDPG
jgi:dimethylamine/trimethylamine dehydrogenase